MKKNIKNLSLATSSLKYKLKISFYLMSILPLLVSAYLVSNYILPRVGLKIDVAVSMVISIFIAIVGFTVVKEVFDRVVSVTTEAKMIAAGDINRRIESGKPDEVGDLSDALNQLTWRIRSNMDELKNYSEKTTEINLEIQKRVIVLSSLLQVSSLISQGAKLEDILKIATEKSRLLANSEQAYLLYRSDKEDVFAMKAVDGLHSGQLLQITVDPKDETFSRLIRNNRILQVDKQNELPANLFANFYSKFKVKNTLAIPVFLKGRVVAILGIANNKEVFLYRKEDVELLDIFAKQVAIAVENDLLINKVEKLEIKDALTGLYNQSFVNLRLTEEIRRAVIYQRPCAFAVIDIDNFKKFRYNYGALAAESILKKIASLIVASVTEIDRVGRTGEGEFSVVLPEKNKRQSQEIVEEIRKKIEFAFNEEDDPGKRLTVSAGIGENPLDGVTAGELIVAAKETLKLAKERGKNRVVSLRN
jgi:diguanylate cyclase (GGDEF)-like protein